MTLGSSLFFLVYILPHRHLVVQLLLNPDFANVDTSLYRNISTFILPGLLEMWFPLNVGRNPHLLLSRLLKIRIPSLYSKGTILFWLKNDGMS